MWTKGLALLALMLVLAPWLAPVHPHHSLDTVEAKLLPPLSERWIWSDENGVSHASPDRLRAPEGAQPHRFWLGSDRQGRDVLSRLLWGGRTSFLFGLVATGVGLLFGALIGALAGWFGGWVDHLLVQIIDGMVIFPALLLLLLISVLARPGPLSLALILGGLSWMTAARITRGEIRKERRSPALQAAEASGIKPARIVFRHLLPAALPPLLVDSSMRIGDAILAEAALSFLGFGISPPTPSWGNMIVGAIQDPIGGWWLALFPGFCITLVVLAFNVEADRWGDRLSTMNAE